MFFLILSSFLQEFPNFTKSKLIVCSVTDAISFSVFAVSNIQLEPKYNHNLCQVLKTSSDSEQSQGAVNYFIHLIFLGLVLLQLTSHQANTVNNRLCYVNLIRQFQNYIMNRRWKLQCKSKYMHKGVDLAAVFLKILSQQ